MYRCVGLQTPIRNIGDGGDVVSEILCDLEVLGSVVEFADGSSQFVSAMKFNYEIHYFCHHTFKARKMVK